MLHDIHSSHVDNKSSPRDNDLIIPGTLGGPQFHELKVVVSGSAAMLEGLSVTTGRTPGSSPLALA